jgi:disulfide bond formation protein DsbB
MFGLSQRQLLVAIGLISYSMLGVALVMEHGFALEPCPLCILQRIGILAGGTVALIAALHYPGIVGIRWYGGLIASAYCATCGIAWRQLWLQSLPADQVPACGPSLDYLLDVLPITEVLGIILNGDGSCAEVAFSFLGLSIPAWVIVGCLPLLVLTGLVVRASRR